jgi:uncharacterized protein (DUF433 family)
MSYADFIVRDPKICGGEPVIRGTRVPLRTVLASLADGDTVEQIVRSFPTVSEEAVRAAIAFAAASAEEDLVTDRKVRVRRPRREISDSHWAPGMDAAAIRRKPCTQPGGPIQ